MPRTTLFRLFQRPVRRAALLLLTTALSGGALVAAAPAGSAAPVVPSLKAPAGLLSPIEPLASYVEQVACQPGYRPGTLALGRLLVATYPNTSFGGPRDCGAAQRALRLPRHRLDELGAQPGAGRPGLHRWSSFLLATDR